MSRETKKDAVPIGARGFGVQTTLQDQFSDTSMFWLFAFYLESCQKSSASTFSLKSSIVSSIDLKYFPPEALMCPPPLKYFRAN